METGNDGDDGESTPANVEDPVHSASASNLQNAVWGGSLPVILTLAEESICASSPPRSIQRLIPRMSYLHVALREEVLGLSEHAPSSPKEGVLAEEPPSDDEKDVASSGENEVSEGKTVNETAVAAAFVPALNPVTVRTTELHAISRRDVFELASGFAMATVMAGVVQPAMAETVVVQQAGGAPQDNEIVKEQRTVTDKLDINNAAVADYMQLPGMYPTIAGKIANNGPYGSVKDVYKVKGLSKEEIGQIKKYEKVLAATPATGLDTLRGRDPYRRNFNK